MRYRPHLTTAAVLVCAVAVVFAAGCKKDPVELAWTFAAGAPIYSTPAVSKDMLVFGNENGEVIAIDKATNTYRWKFVAGMNVISAPRIYQEKVLFGSINYSFYSVDNQGREIWKYATKKPIKSDPVVEKGIVYFTSYDGHLYALRVEDRGVIWIWPQAVPPPPAQGEDTAPPESLIVPGEFSYSSPALANGVLYVGNLDGYIYAVNAGNGTFKWRFKTEDGVTSSPYVDGGMVYVGSNDGNIYALNADTGAKVWTYKTGGWVNSSPRILDGVLYCGSNDKNLYALDAKSGALKGKFAAEGPIVAIPAFYKNFVIAAGGQGDGTVYVLDRATLQTVYKFKTAGKIEADPVVDGDMLYVGSFDRMLYAFKFNVK